jgi:hypothetical protein
MKGKGRWIVLALMAALGVGFGWRWLDRGGGSTPGMRIERVVPESVRIRVEVMNAAGTRGLARRATAVFRDAGFDVVGSGNWSERLDSNLVLIRSGDTTWAAVAARVLGGARVASRPDSSRYLDLTIVLGAAWRPPPEPFDP